MQRMCMLGVPMTRSKSKLARRERELFLVHIRPTYDYLILADKSKDVLNTAVIVTSKTSVVALKSTCLSMSQARSSPWVIYISHKVMAKSHFAAPLKCLVW